MSGAGSCFVARPSLLVASPDSIVNDVTRPRKVNFTATPTSETLDFQSLEYLLAAAGALRRVTRGIAVDEEESGRSMFGTLFAWYG